MKPFGLTQTLGHIGEDDQVNRFDWTTNGANSVTLTDRSGNGLPGAMVLHSDASLSNFTLGSDASSTDSVGNIASHELNFRKPDGTKIAEGTVHGMGSQ